MRQTDIAIIGGGILGLATAYHLTQRFPGRAVTVLEKEKRLAQHQTGRNSGVIHSGIYYTPGSLKAINCREGKASLEAFCEAEELPYDHCGKVIVATTADEIPTLRRIYQNGQANGVDCAMIGPERLREIEPHATGVQAIHVPETGIVDYTRVCLRLARNIEERDGTILTNAGVHDVTRHDRRIVLTTAQGAVEANYLVNCAGLYSDRVAQLTGVAPDVQIVPFRGEYYEVREEAEHLCRGLIYPVPDPSFPFLGVHFTRMIDGGVECGPNAVLAFAREGYRFGTINARDLMETLTFPGFLKLAAKYWRTGLGEMWRSLSRAAFAKALQRLVPEIRAEDLIPAPAGVRAQAVRPDGQMVDDFLIQEAPGIVNVCNAPSPAATASLSIGRHVVDRLSEQF
jgi:L-2-hydroxyglutarate oxidase